MDIFLQDYGCVLGSHDCNCAQFSSQNYRTSRYAPLGESSAPHSDIYQRIVPTFIINPNTKHYPYLKLLMSPMF